MSRKMSDAQIVELFHLAFLQVLQSRLDPARYVLKGGANLRFFYASTRYSEDMDLDVAGKKPWALGELVDGVLSSETLAIVLRSGELAVSNFSKPKQTATTNRWKIALKVGEGARTVRTKVEFSDRGDDPRRMLETVPKRVVAPYALRAPKVQHYLIDAAVAQKVAALSGRSVTQARDVFDLDLLLRRDSKALDEIAKSALARASERALELPFEAFQDQVLPYLEPAAAELYDDAAAWDQMQMDLAERLGEPPERG